MSRWTWRLGAGWTCLLMGRSEDAVPWLKESIAITPASGRSFMLLAAADMQLGRPDEARVAMDRAKALRPGSTLDNVMLPETNAGSDFIAASERLKPALIAAGLPEH